MLAVSLSENYKKDRKFTLHIMINNNYSYIFLFTRALFMYRLECLTTNALDERRLQIAETRMLRKIRGVTHMDKIGNKFTGECLSKVTPVDSKIAITYSLSLYICPLYFVQSILLKR